MVGTIQIVFCKKLLLSVSFVFIKHQYSKPVEKSVVASVARSLALQFQACVYAVGCMLRWLPRRQNALTSRLVCTQEFERTSIIEQINRCLPSNVLRLPFYCSLLKTKLVGNKYSHFFIKGFKQII